MSFHPDKWQKIPKTSQKKTKQRTQKSKMQTQAKIFENAYKLGSNSLFVSKPTRMLISFQNAHHSVSPKAKRPKSSHLAAFF